VEDLAEMEAVEALEVLQVETVLEEVVDQVLLVLHLLLVETVLVV
jgi:hypothetical protein